MKHIGNSKIKDKAEKNKCPFVAGGQSSREEVVVRAWRSDVKSLLMLAAGWCLNCLLISLSSRLPAVGEDGVLPAHPQS